MKSWSEAARDSLATGAVADAAVLAALAVNGRRDSASAIAPINAASHVAWGEEAGAVQTVTVRHTLPGLLINTGAGIWWALVLQKLFGRAVDRGGLPTALAAGAATAGLAYLLDYRLLPRRLSPGWEQRLTPRSVLSTLGVMGMGLGLGAWLVSRRRWRGAPCRSGL